jgi:hypothetical protein
LHGKHEHRCDRVLFCEWVLLDAANVGEFRWRDFVMPTVITQISDTTSGLFAPITSR